MTNAVMLQPIPANLSVPVRIRPVVSAVHVLAGMSRTRPDDHARTWMNVPMNRCVSMDVLICREDIAVNVHSALYNTSTGTSALVSYCSRMLHNGYVLFQNLTNLDRFE